MKNKALLLHHEHYDIINMLSDEEAGALLKAAFEYDINGKVPEFSDRVLSMNFVIIRRFLDSNRERYERVSRSRSKNALKRWNAENGEKNEEAMLTDALASNTNENEKENKKEKENENATVTEKENKKEKENETNLPPDKAEEEQTSSRPKPYGQFSNVYLSDEEILSLKESCNDYKSRIDSFSTYVKLSGSPSSDHYAQLLNWNMFPANDKPPVKPKPPGERREPTFDISAFTSKAVGIKYEPPI